MNSARAAIEFQLVRKIILILYLLVYLIMGIYTEKKLIDLFPIPEHLLQDQRYYDRALNAALEHRDPYANRNIGTGYLYPPQALLIIEPFSHIQPFLLRFVIYSLVNIALLGAMIYGIAKYYGYTIQKVWYWYVLCFGFAPFLELLHIGQINIITMFGIFMMFFWEVSSPVLSGFGFSLAAVTKVSPLLFIGYLFLHKRYKILAVAIIVAALLSLLSILRYGLSPILTYPNVFEGLLNQFLLTTNSQTLAAKLAVANYPQFQQFLAGVPQAIRQPLGSLVGGLTAQYRLVQHIYVLYILLILAMSALITLLGKQPKEPFFIITALGMMLAPNILWYHHYVFMLLPLLVWMGWGGLDRSVVVWCCIGLLIVQVDRRFPPYGLMIHVFSNISMWIVLFWQIKRFYFRKTENELALSPQNEL